MQFDQILQQVAAYHTPLVCVTGGEPLAQKRCHQLLTRLCDAGYRVSLETSGAIDLAEVDPRVVKVVDIKTPDSGECPRNLWDNLQHLNPADQLKFVICSHDDYRWARSQLGSRDLIEKDVIFSPSYQQLELRDLAEWVLNDRLNVRVQIQLHKILWGDVPGK